jgi:flagellar hook assembly protein FlgD
VPNPYDNRTTISYTLPKAETISLTVYDQLGQVVKVLVNESQEAGEHSISFDASDLPSGIYYYTLRAQNYRSSRKMVKF